MDLEDDLCDRLLPKSGSEESNVRKCISTANHTPELLAIIGGTAFQLLHKGGGDGKITTQLLTEEESDHGKPTVKSALLS